MPSKPSAARKAATPAKRLATKRPAAKPISKPATRKAATVAVTITKAGRAAMTARNAADIAALYAEAAKERNAKRAADKRAARAAAKRELPLTRQARTIPPNTTDAGATPLPTADTSAETSNRTETAGERAIREIGTTVDIVARQHVAGATAAVSQIMAAATVGDSPRGMREEPASVGNLTCHMKRTGVRGVLVGWLVSPNGTRLFGRVVTETIVPAIDIELAPSP